MCFTFIVSPNEKKEANTSISDLPKGKKKAKKSKAKKSDSDLPKDEKKAKKSKSKNIKFHFDFLWFTFIVSNEKWTWDKQRDELKRVVGEFKATPSRAGDSGITETGYSFRF